MSKGPSAQTFLRSKGPSAQMFLRNKGPSAQGNTIHEAQIKIFYMKEQRRMNNEK